MLLYDSTGAPNPRRVKIFLAEKGIEVPIKEVTIMKGEHKTPEYRKIAPNGRLPALELDDGTVILETVAICRYFELTQPEPPLFGLGAVGQAQVDMWQRRMELELMMPMAMMFRHTHPAMAQLENQFEDFGKNQQKAVERSLKTLENRLAESPYIAGDHYSIADITAQCSLDFFLGLVRMELPESHTATRKWHEALSARPSAAQV